MEILERVDFKVISPSYKRAGKVDSVGVFKDKLILAVHECEVDEYRKVYPDNEIMVLPDNLRGNMAKVRNYIRDNGGKYILMVDDDVKAIGYHENLEQYVMDYDRLMEFIENGFIMTEELGTVLWGLNVQTDPKFYREYSPFSFLKVVLGPFCGHIVKDDGLRYDERFPLKEDYDFALQVLHKYHKILRFNKYYYEVSHLDKEGGCGSYRILQKEKEQLKLFQKKWGSRVVKYDLNKSVNPVVRVPLKGI